MPSLADRLHDELIAHQLKLRRYENGVRQKIQGALREAEERIELEIRRARLSEITSAIVRRQRAEKLIKTVNKTVTAAYAKARRQLSSEMLGLGEVEAANARLILRQAFGTDVVTKRITKAQIGKFLAGEDSLVLGNKAKEWWTQQRISTQRRLGAEIRLGSLSRESESALVRRIRGTPTDTKVRMLIRGKVRTVARYAGGTMDATKRHADALVKTSTQTASNNVFEETYNNSPIINAVQSVATLDDRTTPLCISRHAAQWNTRTGRPLPSSPRKESYPGPSPWHFNCRTFLIPITGTWAQMRRGADAKTKEVLDRIPKEQRRLMDGKPTKDVTFSDYLKQKPDSEVYKLLGRERFKLWKAGKIGPAQLADADGRTLTLKRLRRFKKPGPKAPKPL